MHPDKSPGLDGFNPGFFHHYWDVVGHDVSATCLQYLHSGTFPSSLNETAIVLLPKKPEPEYMTDLRPIALCNVVLKIMMKMIANRLKCLLPKLISESQSAFIPGRSIQDNCILAFEVMHAFHRKTRGRDFSGALKMDISKAYDKMEWTFVKDVLLRFGFPTPWVNFIYLSLSSVSYWILQEGRQLGPIIPSRGLRQGDPLSPYLYILCAEGLSRLISKHNELGNLHGSHVSRGGAVISHLFFPDDSLLFFKADHQEAGVLKDVLLTYERASGQEISLAKSSLTFSANTPEDVKLDVCAVLGVEEKESLGCYLGLPSHIGRNRREVFNYLKDRVWKRLSSWKSGMLSRVGKAVLLKTVLQAIPSYVMSLFLLPKTIYYEIEGMMNKFWWKSGGENGKGIHWMAWERMSLPKKLGGLGFRRLHDFNLALLGKQGWNLITKPNTLVARVLKARYFSNSTFFDTTLAANPSYLWRSIWESRNIVKAGSYCRVGNGEQTAIGTVSDLMMNGRWNSEIINGVFNDQDRAAIYSIMLPVRAVSDKVCWKFESKGRYTVKSAYRQLQNNRTAVAGTSTQLWQKLWNCMVPPKVLNFGWRLFREILPVLSILQARRMDVLNICPHCHSNEESFLHLFVQCPYARNVWLASDLGWLNPGAATWKEWLTGVFQSASKDRAKAMLMLLWSLWSARNQRVWHHHHTPPMGVVLMASKVLHEWLDAKAKPSVSSTHGESAARTWSRPPAGKLKINSDASVIGRTGMIGGGMLSNFQVFQTIPTFYLYSSPTATTIIIISKLKFYIKCYSINLMFSIFFEKTLGKCCFSTLEARELIKFQLFFANFYMLRFF
ncbi:hypothetical protein K2173_022137 [Erythroxylum novogranatense]|uniref:Reverse transcriptase domain-containing protein n=1 Tax=Erythroxylum novogranatense TaxID=1862640 RepID=A0AAV8SU29_9ROSI|nr:hypothetical protein K2173_022137 [Erythroxylum novogranatense]